MTQEAMTKQKITVKDLTTKELPNWCPACGDFNILHALKHTIVEAGLKPENVVLVSGIGCGSKTPHFVRTYGFEGLHGRLLPAATGIKVANPDLTVIGIGGDGDGYGIGGNHLLHAMRRNIDITYIVQNNFVYGLTKGQYSPTSREGFKSPSSPTGAVEVPLNPMTFGITGGATFVARGYAYEVKHLQELLLKGIQHRGFSLIDVFQPCSTYNKVQTIPWFKQNVYKLEDSGHDPTDTKAAIDKALEWDEGNIPIGLFFRNERPAYDEAMPARADVNADLDKIDVGPIIDSFR